MPHQYAKKSQKDQVRRSGGEGRRSTLTRKDDALGSLIASWIVRHEGIRSLLKPMVLDQSEEKLSMLKTGVFDSFMIIMAAHKVLRNTRPVLRVVRRMLPTEGVAGTSNARSCMGVAGAEPHVRIQAGCHQCLLSLHFTYCMTHVLSKLCAM